MARAKRKRKGRAAAFLLLAGLALLIAGFIARHEIPILIKEAGRSPAAPANADIGGISGGEKLHPPGAAPMYASGGGGGARESEAPGVTDSHKPKQENQSGEHLTGAERRQLENVIREKSR